MSALERDLVRWERGELTLEQVEAAHPEAGVRELMRLHTRLSMLRAISLPDVERAWRMTVPNLAAKPSSVVKMRRPDRFRAWVRRPLVASFSAVVMSGGVAYAAGIEPVQRAVNNVWERARDLGGNQNGTGDDDTPVAAPADTGEDLVQGDGVSIPTDDPRSAAKEALQDPTGPGASEFGRSHQPGHAQNDKEKTKDNNKDKSKHEAQDAAADKAKNENRKGGNDEASGTGGSNGTGGSGAPDQAEAESQDSDAGDQGGDVDMGKPAENKDGAGTAAPPAPDPPGNSNGSQGNGADKSKSKDKTRV